MNTSAFPSDFSMQDFMKGQPRAFSYVFDQYFNAICFFATKIIRDGPAAEDIAQETFIKLWEKHSGFSNPYAIKAFLYITTRNACYNFIKRAQTGLKHQQQWLQVWDEEEENVLSHLVRTETLRDVYALLNALPTECRKIMRYHIIEGKENREIAEMLNISVHTVKNQKARAIVLMKKRLA
ncbi:MAG TPA: RNA polymerase sigma-70 factor, partial [Chitinophagaceae bacterium]